MIILSVMGSCILHLPTRTYRGLCFVSLQLGFLKRSQWRTL